MDHDNVPATKADRNIPVPDGAEFFREQGGGVRLMPITAAAARPGDTVVLPDRRAGTYLGADRVLLEGGEWAVRGFAGLGDWRTAGHRNVARPVDGLAI